MGEASSYSWAPGKNTIQYKEKLLLIFGHSSTLRLYMLGGYLKPVKHNVMVDVRLKES